MKPFYFLRFFYILWVLARYRTLGLLQNAGIPSWLVWWEKLVPAKTHDTRPGTRLSVALQTLGPAFIKLGQTLATRSDLIGNQLAKDLSTLQDRLPACAFDHVRSIIEDELNAPLESLFTHIEETPVAAASVAQVHQATTIHGDIVAVKVLRPHITRQFMRDIAFLRSVARTLQCLLPSTRRLRLLDVVNTLERTTRNELDLRMEAAAASELREQMADHHHLVIPHVYWQLTSRRVMTSEWINAKPFSTLDTESIPEAIRHMLAEELLLGFCRQALVHGFFHADMHPGNLLIDDQHRIVLVDFGITGRLDFETRLFLVRMAEGFLTRNYAQAADAHIQAGIVRRQDRDDFILACRSIADPILELPLSAISVGQLLTQLFSITHSFHMETQPQLILLQKSLILVEGICRTLAPNMPIWETTASLLENTARKHFGLPAQARHHMEEIIQYIQHIPKLLEILALQAENHRKNRPNMG